MSNRRTYSFKTRLGNWQEDYNVSIMNKKEFEEKQQNKLLLNDQRNIKLDAGTTTIELKPTTCAIGDEITLTNQQTGGILSTDLLDKVGTNSLGVTTSTMQGSPCRRNTFIIESTTKEQGEPVRYGDVVTLRTHPDFTSTPYYLTSEFKTPTSYSKKSRKQLVQLEQKKTNNALWQLEPSDPFGRIIEEGEVVSRGACVVLRHVATNTKLASDFHDYYTDYGREFEVCGHNFQVKGKQLTLIREHTGEDTPETLEREYQPQNKWTLN